MAIHFIIDEPLKMKELRIAESSNSAAIELMGRYAVTEDGKPMPEADYLAQIDEMILPEFSALWMDFNRALVPNRRGRT